MTGSSNTITKLNKEGPKNNNTQTDEVTASAMKAIIAYLEQNPEDDVLSICGYDPTKDQNTSDNLN